MLRCQLYMFRTVTVHPQELLFRCRMCRLWYVVRTTPSDTSRWYNGWGRTDTYASINNQCCNSVYLVGMYIYIATCFLSLFWRLEFWSCSFIFITFLHPWFNSNNPQTRTLHTDLTQLIFCSFTFYPPPNCYFSNVFDLFPFIILLNYVKWRYCPSHLHKGACPPCWYYPLL